MISSAEARNIVSQRLAALEDDEVFPPLVLIDEHTEEYKWGWVFYWECLRYFETGEVEDMLVGNFPFIVLREDGSLLQTEGGRPLKDQIAELEQALGFGAAPEPAETSKQKEKKRRTFSFRNIMIFGAVILSALIVAQVGIQAAWYLAVAYFLIAISFIYLKSKVPEKLANVANKLKSINSNP